MIIDAHMHIGDWDHEGFLGRSCTVSDAVDVMRASGVDGAAMAPTDQCDNAGLLADMRAAKAAGFEGPLWFFPWARPVGPDLPGADDIRWIEEHIDAVTGIKMHPSLSRQRVNGDGFRPVLELANRHELVLLIHCGRWQEMASYRFAIEASREHLRAKFLLAHGGGDTPPNATAAAEMVRDTSKGNVWFEFSGLREYWVIERNVAMLGAERYLMGSDYGLAHPLMYIGAVRGMNLPESAKQRILGENALELFGASL